MKLKVRMNEPAILLSKRRDPARFPNSRKTNVQSTPKMLLHIVDFLTARRMAEWLLLRSASEMTGRSSTQKELISADGNRIRGSAIPVSTP